MNDPGVAADYTPLGTNMEFEDLTLPRDKFNRFRYFFIIYRRFTFFLLLDLTIISIWPVWYKLRGPGRAIYFFLLSILITTIVGLPFSAGTDENASTSGVTKDTSSSISFLGEVVRFRPGLDMNKWDNIAARSNRVFHCNNNKITPYFFYDGAECHSYFKWWYIKPGTARVTEASGSETADVGIQPMIDRAVKVYTDGLEKYWGQYMSEINGISEQNK